MGEAALPFTTRLWFAWAAFFRVLLDGGFAARVWTVREALPESAERPSDSEAKSAEAPRAAAVDDDTVERRIAEAVGERERELAKTHAAATSRAREDGASLLLSLLQQQGRLVDFLKQDVTSFSDADVGAAARVVHEGCRATLERHAELAPVRSETEGKRVTVTAADASGDVKLTGDLKGDPPFEGTLRHRGWRATKLSLPIPTAGHDATLICQAEVEL